MLTQTEAIDLGRRALAAGMEWPKCGTLLMLVMEADDDPWYTTCLDEGNRAGLADDGAQIVPDFRDPRAKGWLLAEVRRVVGDPAMYAKPEDSLWSTSMRDRLWSVVSADMKCVARAVTEAEVLVAALEVAKAER